MCVCDRVCEKPSANYLYILYLNYLCKLISVCHQRLFIVFSAPQTRPLLEQEVLTVVQMLLSDFVLPCVK